LLIWSRLIHPYALSINESSIRSAPLEPHSQTERQTDKEAGGKGAHNCYIQQQCCKHTDRARYSTEYRHAVWQ